MKCIIKTETYLISGFKENILHSPTIQKESFIKLFCQPSFKSYQLIFLCGFLKGKSTHFKAILLANL